MRHKYLFISILTYSSIAFSQKFQNSIFDTLLNNKSKAHKYEIRITKDISLSNHTELTRIFQDSLDNWFLEKYYSNGKDDENLVVYELDEYDETLQKDSLKIYNTNRAYRKNLETTFYKNWLELITTNILELPDFKEIQYKLNKKTIVDIDNNGKLEIIEEVIIITDGEYLTIEIKDDKDFNKFSISNPDYFISKFPDIDELIFLNNFLKQISVITKNN